jgi:lysophospholipase L1-like esterase
VSFNVVADLARRLPQFGFVNAGVNGNTSTQVLARLAAVLARTPRFVIVHVGANDVLAIHGGAASDAVAAAKWDGLEANLRAIVRGLSAAGARVGLMSLQPVGEQLGSALNQRVDRANEIIRRTADAEGVGYLPLHERLAEVIATDGTGRAVPDSLAMVARAVVLHLGLGVSLDRIGRRNGFVVHSDGLHLASRGGRIAADLIESFIETEVHSDP